jgi:hypothetical protein
VTAGTILDKTRTPLTIWFEAAWHLTIANNGLSAKTLERTVAGKERQLAAGTRRHAAHDEPHQEALLAEGGVGDLGDRGSRHELGDRRPALLRERGEPRLQVLVQVHGDRGADRLRPSRDSRTAGL